MVYQETVSCQVTYPYQSRRYWNCWKRSHLLDSTTYLHNIYIFFRAEIESFTSTSVDSFLEDFAYWDLDLLDLRKKFDQSLVKGTEASVGKETEVSNADLSSILKNAQKITKQGQKITTKKPARALRTGQPRLSGTGFCYKNFQAYSSRCLIETFIRWKVITESKAGNSCQTRWRNGSELGW